MARARARSLSATTAIWMARPARRVISLLIAIEDAERAAAHRADAQQADVDGSHGSSF